MSKAAVEDLEVLSNADILSFQFGNRITAAVPKVFVTWDWFLGRQFFRGPGGWWEEMVSG